MTNGFNRRCGAALLFGGVLTILINAILSPLLLSEHSQPSLEPATTVFLVRQSASGLVALLLIFGSLGLHLAQRTASGVFGGIAFVTAFIGGCFLFGVEFTDVFVLRAVAQASADTYAAIDKNTFMTIGFASAAALFAIGWLLLSISVWRTGKLSRWAALTTFAGLFLIPALQAGLGVVGAIVGNAVFGIGLAGLGWALTKLE
jgi:hypothetical protein